MILFWMNLIFTVPGVFAFQTSPDDPHSFSRPDLVRVTHMHFNLEVSFDDNTLNGSATLNVEKVDRNTTTLMLDVKNLTIFMVTDDDTGEELDHEIAFEHEFGSRLDIELPEHDNDKETFTITIHYATDPQSEALQWLETNQTTDKLLPYMFSQNQPINCRAMAPVQDTPSNKITYSAEIIAPEEFTVLMSAVKSQSEKETDVKTRHHFRQKVPIVTYLIAIAVGKLESRDIGPRSKVWAEPSMADKAASEFSDIENAITTAESLLGPYEWEVFDILVLPNFFPYLGMENPCITFTSPVVVAGDKSMVYVINHELSHAWTGNLVSNINNNHFWLNEGFTVYFEQRISAITEGPGHRGLVGLSQWKELKNEMQRIGESKPATALVVDLTDTDPVEAFTLVPYFKGQIFLRYLEDLMGIDELTAYLKNYIETFKFKSLATDDFKDHFLDYFMNDTKVDEIDWNQWLYGTGMPNYKPDYDETLAKESEMLAKKWMNDWNSENRTSFDPDEFFSLSGPQRFEFFSQLLEGEPLSHDLLEAINDLYEMSNTTNAKVRGLWIRIGLKAEWEPAVENAVDLVSTYGSVTINREIYQTLYENEKTRDVAVETFKKMKPLYFSNAVKLIETVLEMD